MGLWGVVARARQTGRLNTFVPSPSAMANAVGVPPDPPPPPLSVSLSCALGGWRGKGDAPKHRTTRRLGLGEKESFTCDSPWAVQRRVNCAIGSPRPSTVQGGLATCPAESVADRTVRTGASGPLHHHLSSRCCSKTLRDLQLPCAVSQRHTWAILPRRKRRKHEHRTKGSRRPAMAGRACLANRKECVARHTTLQGPSSSQIDSKSESVEWTSNVTDLLHPPFLLPRRTTRFGDFARRNLPHPAQVKIVSDDNAKQACPHSQQHPWGAYSTRTQGWVPSVLSLCFLLCTILRHSYPTPCICSHTTPRLPEHTITTRAETRSSSPPSLPPSSVSN